MNVKCQLVRIFSCLHVPSHLRHFHHTPPRRLYPLPTSECGCRHLSSKLVCCVSHVRPLHAHAVQHCSRNVAPSCTFCLQQIFFLGFKFLSATAFHSLLSPGPRDNAVDVSHLPLQAVAHPPDCPAQHLNILRVLAFAANHTAHLDVKSCTHLQSHVLSSERDIITTHSDSRGMEE